MKERVSIALIAAILILVAPGAKATPPGFNGLIAFSSGRTAGNQPDIWTMAPDGLLQTNLTNDWENASYIDPAWSPDGTKVAYARSAWSPNFSYELWVINANGSDRRQLTSGFIDEAPAWSPDGTRIAFASTRPFGGTGHTRHVWVMNSDGTSVRQLTDDSTTRNAVGNHPDWSPDGTRIAFDDGFDVYTMNADGSNVSRLTTDPGHDWDPSFSPNGASIAFASNRADEQLDIYVMSASGASQTRLTEAQSAEGEPVWSPDGTKIAFVSNYATTFGFRVWVMNADGSNETPLIDPVFRSEDDHSPSWKRTFTAPRPPPSPLRRCQVPHVVGQKLARARAKIRARHCRVGRITKKHSSLAKRGKVLSQKPKAGKLFRNGTKVSLKVGTRLP